ncbi:MAG TPA: TonB-dependent receptor [Polyangiaceae bacterium]|nr:TonB-dependent receptor [Polyangiaceae bacterium]
MNRAARVTALLLAAPALLVRVALAEDCKADAQHPDACKPVEVVVTGTRTPESSQRATVRTDFVTRKEAERRGATNVAEALAGEPNLQVNPENYGYLGRPSGVMIQGLDADRVLILEDGERVVGDQDGVVDLAQLPIADVERIEYVAGPTSSLYGSNALGGVINVVTAPPAAQGPSSRYRGELRSTGEGLATLGGAYRELDSWLVLDTSYHYRPGVLRSSDRPDLVAAKWRSTLLGLRAGTKLARNVELKLRGRWVRDRSDGLESEDVPGLGRFLIDLPDTTDRFLLRAQETVLLAGGSRIDFSLARSWYIDESRRDRRNSPLDELRKKELSNQGLEGIVTVPEGTRTWVLGVRSDAEHFEQTLTRTLPDLSHEGVTEIQPRLLASGALYAQVGWKVTDKWTVMPGGRAELHDRYGVVPAPRLATAYQFTPKWSARAAFGRGFRAPTAKEFGFQFDHSALGYRVLGNGQLRPESSWGLTADTTWRAKEWRLRVGGFFNHIKDLISIDFAPEQRIAGVTDYVYKNVERARTAGGDVSARLKVAQALSFDAGYAYLWTRDLDSDEQLPNRPPHTLTLSALLELEKLSATLRYRITASAFAGRIDEVERTSPHYDLLDARVSYRLWPALSLFVGALNITDSRRNALEPTDTRPVLGRQFYFGISGDAPAD